MIELKIIRFVKYDVKTHKVIVLLLTDENESLEMDLLLGFPEVMGKELIDQIIVMNSAVSKVHGEDHEIDIQKIIVPKLEEFFVHVITYITRGKMKAPLEANISEEELSDEDAEETL